MGLLFGTKLILYTNIGLSVKVAVTVIPLPDFLRSPAVPDLLEKFACCMYDVYDTFTRVCYQHYGSVQYTEERTTGLHILDSYWCYKVS